MLHSARIAVLCKSVFTHCQIISKEEYAGNRTRIKCSALAKRNTKIGLHTTTPAIRREYFQNKWIFHPGKSFLF